MTYRVNIKKSDEGYAVWCPGLPGCWSQGDSEDQALENIKDAIREYLLAVDELSQDEESRLVDVGILKRADSQPSLEEILAPLRNEFDRSGMTEDELTQLLEQAKHEARAERRANKTS